MHRCSTLIVFEKVSQGIAVEYANYSLKSLLTDLSKPAGWRNDTLIVGAHTFHKMEIWLQ